MSIILQEQFYSLVTVVFGIFGFLVQTLMSLSIDERCRINHLSTSIIALSQVVIEVFIYYLFFIL